MKNSVLVIETKHGLGNRLRALASANAVAGATQRQCILAWEPDTHCNCRFTDLFTNPITQISEPVEKQELKGMGSYYCYVDHHKTNNLQDDLLKCTTPILYVVSQKVLHTSRPFWNEENTFLKSLSPIDAITRRVASMQLPPGTIGVHIRELAAEHNSSHPADDPTQWDEEGRRQMFYWRSKSTRPAFQRRMERSLEENPGQSFYVAADNPHILTELKARFGNRIHCQARIAYGRDLDSIIEALVDIYLLAQCKLLFGSQWSSFTELVIRLGGMRAELAGVHFD